ncbi:hypothetical protein ACFFUB_13655 [Algimonas porphyrae]|uniref:Uncharacterized protein n=1 Tax=Algimonas porphyrae TaxID=1128113 RepID=A0ABQ5UW11_9PROT|nr:hypothetical protein [Algimonas porphyrae]GLQ19466.1 hypothetical protein GCM10007854_04210 [Algimonas porphyrae]
MDVSGFWTGEYAYDEAGHPVVTFDMDIKLAGDVLSGICTETNSFIQSVGQFLISDVFGNVTEHDVSFEKSYTNTPHPLDTIRYRGSVSTDGLLITGRWVIPHVCSGSFRMTRATEQPPRTAIDTPHEIEPA